MGSECLHFGVMRLSGNVLESVIVQHWESMKCCLLVGLKWLILYYVYFASVFKNQ